jgi:hypothetical protein
MLEAVISRSPGPKSVAGIFHISLDPVALTKTCKKHLQVLHMKTTSSVFATAFVFVNPITNIGRVNHDRKTLCYIMAYSSP